MSSCQLSLTEKEHTDIHVESSSDVVSKSCRMGYLFMEYTSKLPDGNGNKSIVFACLFETVLHLKEDLFAFNTSKCIFTFHICVKA